MGELDKALEIFGLDKIMFNQMKKLDLKVFIQSSIGRENKSDLKRAYGQVLLNAKTKQVTFYNEQTRSRSQSFSIEYYAPTSASIDILFNSLVCADTFI